MKRTLVVLALLLAVGILCFADDAAKPAGITFASWSRAIYAPLASVNSAVAPGMGVSWGADARVGFVIKADSETAGFHLTMNEDNHSFGVSDDLAVYVKPMPGLTFTGGRPYDDTLRNNGAAFGSWNWIRQNTMIGEDFGFDRVNGGNHDVAEVSYSANGLYVYVAQSRPANDGGFAPYGAGKDVKNDALRNMDYGFGYTIAGIGQIKAQQLGYAFTGSTFGVYEIGFAVSAIPNLSAEADIKIPTDNKVATFDMIVPVSGSYKADKATINFAFQLTQNNDQNTATGKKSSIAGALGVDYDLGDGLGFTSDVRYYDKYGNGTGKAQTSVFGGINKGLAIGQIGIGFEYVTTGGFGGSISGNTEKDGTAYDVTKGQWAIPIKWEVSF